MTGVLSEVSFSNVAMPPADVAYRKNGHPVSAAGFYAIACEPARSVAIEACAGAGKTWMLVSRIVRALLNGIERSATNATPTSASNLPSPLATSLANWVPDEILAITFTKRSASEMRERLNEWLEQFAHADEPTLLRELAARGVTLPIDPIRRTEMASALSKLYFTILKSGRLVQIRTFHSWFAALLRTAPVAVLAQLSLPAVYELLEDDSQARALVWRRFYATVSANPALLADFKALVFAHGRYQAGKALQAALEKRSEFALADACGIVDASVATVSAQFPEFEGFEAVDDFLIIVPANWQILLAAAAALGQAKAATYAAKGQELEMALSAKDMDAAFLALLTKEGTSRKFGEKIAGIERVRLAQDLVQRVVAARKQREAWLHQQRMARLTRVLIAEYASLKRLHAWVDMNDVERAAKVMLGDAVLSAWVQAQLDARIKHLLIDEFQDTNPLQWQALSSWLSSYAGSGGGSAPSVFLVGDPKQSIYRFRRAEPQVFKAAQVFVKSGLAGDLLECDHTRRNARQVIETINSVMGEAQAAGEFEGFRAHTSASKESGLVCKLPPIARDAIDKNDRVGLQPGDWRDSLTQPQHLPDESLRTLEARQAASWIAQQLAAGYEAQNIMVLARQRASLGPMQDELRKLGIAAQIGEKTGLQDCCEVQDLVALLDVLVSPQHDLSLARVLKSPLFDVEDSALVNLAVLQRAQTKPWFELLQQVQLKSPGLGRSESTDPAEIEVSCDETRPAQRDVATTLARWQAWVNVLPPHDALQAIYDDGDVLARYAVRAIAAQRTAVLSNLRSLLGVSLQLNGGRFLSPYGFVRALKSSGVQTPVAVVQSAVRLLTIHGAKGLEADVVLLLDTDTNERVPDTMGILVDWPGESAEPVKFVFLVSENEPPACAVDALAFEVAQRKREELNALYVAMTRARRVLAVSSIEPSRPTGRSVWARITALPSVEAARWTSVKRPDTANVFHDSRQAETKFSLKVLPALQVKLAVSKPQATLPLASSTDAIAARIGKAMHRLLEWGDASPQNSQAAAREFELTAPQAKQALEMARRMLNGAGAWCWQSETLLWEGNELEMSIEGETFRLDRLVQRQDNRTWWVLDFKSNARPQQDPDLVAQLSRYRDAVQSIYIGQVVKAAFLTAQGEFVEL